MHTTFYCISENSSIKHALFLFYINRKHMDVHMWVYNTIYVLKTLQNRLFSAQIASKVIGVERRVCIVMIIMSL